LQLVVELVIYAISVIVIDMAQIDEALLRSAIVIEIEIEIMAADDDHHHHHHHNLIRIVTMTTQHAIVIAIAEIDMAEIESVIAIERQRRLITVDTAQRLELVQRLLPAVVILTHVAAAAAAADVDQ
jgi:hypothetical protein